MPSGARPDLPPAGEGVARRVTPRRTTDEGERPPHQKHPMGDCSSMGCRFKDSIVLLKPLFLVLLAIQSEPADISEPAPLLYKSSYTPL